MNKRIEAILDADDNDDLRTSSRLAERLVAEAPHDARAWAARARVRYKQGNCEAAEADISAALKLDPDCVDALWMRAVMIDDDEAERAVAEFDRILQRQPDHYGCLMSRGWALGQLDRVDAAVASCTAALRVRPQRKRPANNAVHILMQADRIAEASDFYERLAAARPDDGMTAYNAGTHYYQIDQFEKAIVHLDRGRRLLGEQNAIQHNRALTLQALGRHAEAVEEWSLLLKREPDWDWPLRSRERSLRALGRIEEADADFRHWQQVVGEDSNAARYPEAKRYYDGNDYAQALRILNQSIADGQADEDIFNLAGLCHAEQGEHAIAKSLYERGLQVRGDQHYLHMNYAATLLALDDPAGALAHAETAIALEPDNGSAHGVRGRALVKLDRASDAVPELEQWVAADRTRYTPLIALIETLQSLGRHSEVLARCDEMIGLLPTDGWAYWTKAESCEALGNLPNAKLAYQKAYATYLAQGKTKSAEDCRKAGENVGQRKRGLFAQLFDGKG